MSKVEVLEQDARQTQSENDKALAELTRMKLEAFASAYRDKAHRKLANGVITKSISFQGNEKIIINEVEAEKLCDEVRTAIMRRIRALNQLAPVAYATGSHVPAGYWMRTSPTIAGILDMLAKGSDVSDCVERFETANGKS